MPLFTVDICLGTALTRRPRQAGRQIYYFATWRSANVRSGVIRYRNAMSALASAFPLIPTSSQTRRHVAQEQTAARLLEQFMGAPSNLASSSAVTHQHRRGFGLFGQEAIGFDFRWPAEDALRHRPRLLPERRKRLGEMLIARRLRGVDLVKQEHRGLLR